MLHRRVCCGEVVEKCRWDCLLLGDVEKAVR